VVKVVAVGVFSASIACAALPVTVGIADRVANGTWGGEHAALTVTDTGAHLEFDCATGDITQPLLLDERGHLVVDGVFVRQRAGPARSDEPVDRRPARYSGRVEGKTMTFDVILIGADERVGTFTVIHGEEPVLFKCM
jgi:hypothetical protein